MRAVALVKQVPDVRVGNVGVRPDGTIDRASAPAITNPADLHAVEAALELADETIAISMGPPRAEAALRQAISLGVDRGVLLTDRLFAGSDTWATANALAAAIRHLGGADLVLAGVSALDGETGNVGPQVAQRLGVPDVVGCEELEVEDGRLVARRVVEGGFEVVSLPLPAVVTVSETGFLPRYPTLPGRRKGAKAELTVLSASEIGLDEATVGLGASPTKVSHMELVPMPKIECRFLGDGFGYADLVGELVERDVFAEVHRTDDEFETIPSQSPPLTDKTDIWVVCETREGELARVSAELISKSVELAAGIRSAVGAVLIGSGLDAAVEQAGSFGADRVYVAEDERLSDFRGIPEAKTIVNAIRRHEPQMVLFGATTRGRSVAPRVAAMLDTGIAADCTDLYISDWERLGERHEDVLHQVRPAMAGGVLATCLCPEARPQIATVRPGVFPAAHHPRSPIVERLTINLTEGDFAVRLIERSLQVADIPLADADYIVAGGAGCSAANWHLVEELATQIGGKVAASRAAVEAGLAPRSFQIGQTGSTVHPKLYVACGISGALQHVVGMRAAGTTIAINRDPDATIFRFANYGVVGDVTDVLPLLSEALAAVRVS